MLATSALARLRNRLLRRTLPVWYTTAYRLPLAGVAATSGFEPRRADYVAWWLLECGAIAPRNLRTPRRASYEDLDRVHALELIDSLSRPESLGRIFAVDPTDLPVDALVSMVLLACGGTMEAARQALEHGGATLNLLGGFHHAAPNAAGGFCPVDDVAVALAALREEGFAGRTIVLDLDAHPPDGIAACLERDGAAWVGSLSGSDWGPLEAVDETVLPAGTGDEVYLTALAALLGRMPRPKLAFVIAGGDVLAGDRFGRLGLTLAGARRRDLEVARALAGAPSVWLPAGGYHRDSWRVLAGTGMVLTLHSGAPVPRNYEPLAAHFASISSELDEAALSETDFTCGDTEDALGLVPRRRRQPLFLRHYTAVGLEHMLYRYGVLDQLRRVGYQDCRAVLDETGTGDRLRVLGKPVGDARAEEQVLIELVAERRHSGPSEVLYVHWLSLRNPRSQFSSLRPALPGQEVPGLGLAREIGEMLGLMAQRLELRGVVFRPAHFHTAYVARHNFSFIDAARQGRFEALLRDLAPLPLLHATRAVCEGRVALNGAPYAWEPDEMALWLKPSPDEARGQQVSRERERCRFEIAPGAA
ncbi:MAG TPA: histone deacetylase [Anaeromyxobacteraceae bacterium]|nr:histone deacetylase [Anaeromyxobacteraceae bacterium]